MNNVIDCYIVMCVPKYGDFFDCEYSGIVWHNKDFAEIEKFNANRSGDVEYAYIEHTQIIDNVCWYVD